MRERENIGEILVFINNSHQFHFRPQNASRNEEACPHDVGKPMIIQNSRPRDGVVEAFQKICSVYGRIDGVETLKKIGLRL